MFYVEHLIKGRKNMKVIQYIPEVSVNDQKAEKVIMTKAEIIGDTSCPCCGFITIPNKGDALGYICPVCFWEIDLFIKSEDEPSDLNHGLTLIEARENYKKYGAVKSYLKQHCREPKQEEYPKKA